MNSSSRFASGIFTALLTSLIAIGSLSLSLAEGQTGGSTVLSPTATVNTSGEITPAAGTLSAQTFTPSATPTITPTFAPPSSCPIPRGWITYTILPGDTLESLADAHHITVDELVAANCLTTQQLIPNTVLYLPAPTGAGSSPTATTEACGAPLNWVPYIVQSNDTLYRLSIAFRVSVYEIQLANCMGASTLIRTGDRIYVPNVPTTTPTNTPTARPTHTTSPVPTTMPTEAPTPAPTLEPTAAATVVGTTTPALVP
ncbi:MAG: LysM peptidoglycan-binding domain-containing protein [Anaerolineaceae bacterium]